MAIHEHLPRIAKTGTKVDGMDQGPGVGKGGSEGRTDFRLCTLGAQGKLDAQGGIQARGRAPPDRAGDRAARESFTLRYTRVNCL